MPEATEGDDVPQTARRQPAAVVRAVADMSQVQNHWSEMMLAVALGDRERYVASRLRWRAAELALFADTFGPSLEAVAPGIGTLFPERPVTVDERRRVWRRSQAPIRG